jgi:hypothetical protein
MEQRNLSSPVILYLIGLAGTGKLTIAQALKPMGFKIIDNHLINDPIFRTLQLDGNTPIPQAAWDAVEQIRNIVLKFIANESKQSFIFTNELLEGCIADANTYNRVKRTAKQMGAIFIPVRLLISQEERNRRIVSEERRYHCKKVTVDRRKSIEVLFLKHPNLLNFDVTTLTAQEAALLIEKHINEMLKRAIH